MSRKFGKNKEVPRPVFIMSGVGEKNLTRKHAKTLKNSLKMLRKKNR